MTKKTAKKVAKHAAKHVVKRTAKLKAKASVATAAKDLAWLTPAKLKSIRAALVSMRDDILRTVRKQSIHEVDNGDSVDQASQSIEKELMFELSDNERTTLDMVEAAIRKIDNGTYGLCEATQKPITRARLEAIAYARYSIAYQNQIEQKVTEAAEPGLDFSVIGETERVGE